MKKTLLSASAALLALTAFEAKAENILNPFYLPENGFMSDTTLSYTHAREKVAEDRDDVGASRAVEEAVTYGFNKIAGVTVRAARNFGIHDAEEYNEYGITASVVPLNDAVKARVNFGFEQETGKNRIYSVDTQIGLDLGGIIPMIEAGYNRQDNYYNENADMQENMHDPNANEYDFALKIYGETDDLSGSLAYGYHKEQLGIGFKRGKNFHKSYEYVEGKVGYNINETMAVEGSFSYSFHASDNIHDAFLPREKDNMYNLGVTLRVLF